MIISFIAEVIVTSFYPMIYQFLYLQKEKPSVPTSTMETRLENVESMIFECVFIDSGSMQILKHLKRKRPYKFNLVIHHIAIK